MTKARASHSRLRHTLLANLALLTLAFVAGLAVTEVSFRGLLRFGIVQTATDSYSAEPYGYYFWSKEDSYATGFNNRYGYADHDYETKKPAASTRIAIVGDSFVEALQVPISEKMGPRLQERLNRVSSSRFEVLSLGRSGEYPGYYLERVKQAVNTFSADVVFVVFYLGNDFRNASREMETRTSGVRPDQYIFYEVDRATGEVRPHPQSVPVIDSFAVREAARWSHMPSLLQRADLLLKRLSLVYSEVPSRWRLFRTSRRVPSKVGEVLNPQFTHGADDWTAGSGARSTAGREGDQPFLRVWNGEPSVNSYVEQSVAVERGVRYEFSVTMRKGAGPAQPAVFLGQRGAIAKYLEHSTRSEEWTRFSGEFTTTGPEVLITLQAGTDVFGATAEFADVSLRRRAVTGPTLADCIEETIYLKAYDKCWTDSVLITRRLVMDMKQFAAERQVDLFFVGIPANETFWGDAEGARSLDDGQGSRPSDYRLSLAARFGVPKTDVDLDRPTQLFHDVMDGARVNCIDMKGVFADDARKHARSPFSGWFNGHLNAEGHRLVAEEMMRLVNPEVLADVHRDPVCPNVDRR